MRATQRNTIQHTEAYAPFNRGVTVHRVCRISLIISSLILLQVCRQLLSFQRALTTTTIGDVGVAILLLSSARINDTNVFAGQSITSEESIRREALVRYSQANTSLLPVLQPAHVHLDHATRTAVTTRNTLRQTHLRNKLSKQAIAGSADVKAFPAPIKLPFPIFVASLFKSGTTTVHSYFTCGGQRSVHWKNADQQSTGKCIRQNLLQEARDPFQGCGEYDIWSDHAVLQPPDLCWDPSVHGLEAIYKAYPNATILLTVRDSNKWLNSVIRWGKLLDKLRGCRDLWPLQNKTRRLTTRDIRDFYEWHQQHVRRFVALHPSMTFVQVDLESSETASILEERVGIPAPCWGHYNRNDEGAGLASYGTKQPEKS